jgi:hypothetical protein
MSDHPLTDEEIALLGEPCVDEGPECVGLDMCHHERESLARAAYDRGRKERNGMSDPLQGWFIVELLGHRRLAGYVTEQTIAGAGFLRIDVPGHGAEPIATQFFAPSSVYALTPTTEDMARRVAEASRIEPVKEWELPSQRSLPGRSDDADEDHEGGHL